MKSGDNVYKMKKIGQISSDIIRFLLSSRYTNYEDLFNEFDYIDENFIKQVINLLIRERFIEICPDEKKIVVSIINYSQVSKNILSFYNPKDDMDELPMLISKMEPLKDKKVVSEILDKAEYEWKNINRDFPRRGIPYVIRLVDNKSVLRETGCRIYPKEDVKIATIADGKWTILPPYPKYDFSPLSVKGSLNESVSVTHFAELKEGDLESWTNRFTTNLAYIMKNPLEENDEKNRELYKSLLTATKVFKGLIEDLENKEKLTIQEACNLQDYKKSIESINNLIANMDNY